MGLDRTIINKIEGGSRRVTALELADIATAIGVRMSTFFEVPLPAIVSHRSSQGLDTADSQIDALLSDLAHEVGFIESLGVRVVNAKVPEVLAAQGFTRPDTNAEAETLAATARRLMGIEADTPIKEISESVAKIGLLAFSRDLGKDTADAGTILMPKGGVSLVNSYMKVGRRRLALAHELGHFLVADAYTIDWRVANPGNQSVSMETRLDRFARALLLPADALARGWQELADSRGERYAAIQLASRFRVDMATLATRLWELELAESEVVTSVRNYRTTQSDIVEMNLHVPLEEMAGTTIPRPFALAVIRLVQDERISRERALHLLQDTFVESDLPAPRERRPDEIWAFVS